MSPLPLSNGNQHILLIGNDFSKFYEAIALPDQTASTTATALLENWVCQFGCPHSIHSDQGRNFESKLFKTLNLALQVNKTWTTAFQLQSNAVVERMNRTLQCRCLSNASVINKATGHNSYRKSWWHTVPRSMNPQGTPHIFLSTDRKSAFLSTSCTQTQLINLQPTSMNICLPDKLIFKKPMVHLVSRQIQSPWTHLSSRSKGPSKQLRCSSRWITKFL